MAWSRVAFAPVLLVAACASASHPAAVANTAGRPPPPMPATMIAADFAAMVEHAVLAPIELAVVSRAEISIDPIDREDIVAADQLVVTNALPGGWSQTVYADGAHRLWIVSHRESFHGIAGGPTPTTHVFSTTLTIPPGYVLGGTISVVDDPAQLPPMRAPARSA